MPNADLWKAMSGYNGPQLFVALVIVLIVAISVFARFYLAPGTARLAEASKDRDDAVGILKAQLERTEKEKDEIEERNRVLEHQVRTLQTVNVGFNWMKKNPAALRLLADQVEKEQAKLLEKNG